MLIPWFYYSFVSVFPASFLPPPCPRFTHTHDEALGAMLRQMQKKPLSWSLPPRSSRSASSWDLKMLKQETLLQQCRHF